VYRRLALLLLTASCQASVPQPVLPPIRALGAQATTAARRQEAAREEAPPRRWQFREPRVPREQSDVRVLLYHSFGWFGEMRPAVSPYALRTQLDWLEEHRVEVIPLGALLDFLDGLTELPARSAVITIDDGELNGFTVAYPILLERRVPFVLALATEAIENHATRGTIPWPKLRQMLDSGLVTIASHSHTHRNLTGLSDDELGRELDQSRRRIETELGVSPEVFVYPLGAHDARVQAAVRGAGYRAAFAAMGGPVGASSVPFALPRYGVEASTHLFAFAHYLRHRGSRPR
jgi:peptidoglycan/xylan/chitin deacetylase (PgdA/CDA1 family)